MQYFEKNNRQHPFTSNLAGEKWFRLFLNRHPQLRHRKAQAMNPARAQKLNRFIVNDHFTKLEQAIIDLDLFDKPDRILNLGEKGCHLSLHHQQRVIALKGNKRVHLVAPEHGENVTVVACVSAVGGVIPPMIIFKGKNRKQQFGDDLPPLACFEIAEKGSMTNELFVKWLQHFSKFKPQGSILLIFDGAKCHLSIDILEEADRHNITLFCLPSNTIHELQPLDTAAFRSFEYHWDQEVF
ncbi:tigger transposable element-derived protein 1-like [Plakobranchus ocellatus]|uniref:Tigger transposable element-derived protein 1-like n=1 Tax=Plakobranchus ocellatus TaxID=259542 RepID=A0AAV3YXL7_9GAST|nr:tigger transposable element-derived protein 1-like [Plakobranchus ocellatus]